MIKGLMVKLFEKNNKKNKVIWVIQMILVLIIFSILIYGFVNDLTSGTIMTIFYILALSCLLNGFEDILMKKSKLHYISDFILAIFFIIISKLFN